MPETLVKPKSKLRWLDYRWQLSNRARSAPALRQLIDLLETNGYGSHRFPAFKDEVFAEADRRFRFAVTPYYLSLSSGEAQCPIWRQILPDERETNDTLFTQMDPLAEESHMPVRGLTHRYPDRALWYVTHSCAVYCRFCMRKRKVSQSSSAPRQSDRQQALDYIRAHPEIQEVILSGGDPLLLPDHELADLLEELRRIPSLISIRIHTRIPVVLPMRVDRSLCKSLADFYPLTMVTHFNHAREITDLSRLAVERLRRSGIQVLNQSVLLKGINDSLAVQRELLLGLMGMGVQPYYLHALDEVQGVSHFKTDLRLGTEIIAGLRGTIPGHAIPRYMVDLTGGGGKVSLEPSSVIEETADALVFKNYQGRNFLRLKQES
ncbi:MAG: KamA family radical SAM protein [Spirochaetales bacterium]|nr:KamA family radical SAM protein [Spirochaetales bacterium]